MSGDPWTPEDLDRSPFIAFYEVTRACDLVCRHCRACAQPRRHPKELSTEAARGLLEQVAAFPKVPQVVLTGGDPLKREDVAAIVRHGARAGLRMAMTPSATPLVTVEAMEELRAAGLGRVALSLDGADAATHDAFRGFTGSFARTREILAAARRVGLPVQVNTTVTRRNAGQIDAMAERLAEEGIVLWSVFFLVPVGRGRTERRISPEAYETVFERLRRHAGRQPYAIKTTEAPHYRRYVLERDGDPQRDPAGHRSRAPLGVRDGKGVVFISHTGQVFPSGFLPMECGRFPRDSVVDVYQNHALFRRLRDAEQLRGKCGACEYRRVCGGSRARAYAVTRDPLAAEPDCVYVPQANREAAPC